MFEENTARIPRRFHGYSPRAHKHLRGSVDSAELDRFWMKKRVKLVANHGRVSDKANGKLDRK